MRMSPSGSPLWNTEHARLQRAALWSAYFHRFFGSAHGQVPAGHRPLTFDDSCEVLRQVYEDSKQQHPRPEFLTRCLSQMALAGYRPSGDYKARFDTLASAARNTTDPARAFKSLLDHGRRHYAPRALRALPIGSADSRADEVSVIKEPKPTEATFDGWVWTVKKEYVIDKPIGKVAQLLNPVNWECLTPYFKETRRVDPPKTASSGPKPWSGTLHERVVVNWNATAFQSFEAFLNIDYTLAKDAVRADYSLQYEKDSQILVDDGYAEARREKRLAKDPNTKVEVTRYTAFKRLRFESSFLNLVAPAVMSMFLENDEAGISDVLGGGGGSATPDASVLSNDLMKGETGGDSSDGHQEEDS